MTPYIPGVINSIARLCKLTITMKKQFLPKQDTIIIFTPQMNIIYHVYYWVVQTHGGHSCANY